MIGIDMPEEFASRRALEARQLAQLQGLLAIVNESNPFYRKKFREARLSGLVASVADFAAAYPFTGKEELVQDQLAHSPYGTNLTYGLERYVRCHQTSSTSGRPIRWLDTAQSWNWMLDSWTRVLEASGVQTGDRIFFAFSFGPFLGLWTAFEAALRLGCCCLPGGGMSSVARLKAIVEQQVNGLCCTPSYALHLAEIAAAEGLDLRGSPIRKIIVAGEPGGSVPATRRRIESLWPGARVYDHHGMTEVGPVSYECPKHPCRLHVIEEAYFAEVIDPATGRKVGAGEGGELVLTTLGRVGSPLIRYRTGDRVQPVAAGGERCACGTWDLALEGGIVGRIDDMVIVRGINVFPSLIEEIVRGCAGVAEYRVWAKTDRAMAELEVEIEAPPGWSNPAAVVAELEKRLQAGLTLRVPVRLAAAGALPRFEGKGRRWFKADGPSPAANG